MSHSLTVGTRLDDGAPATLDARRLNRHTFWCGQSGSGKTYALGVLLERVLVETGVPLVILDPNSDFVHLGEVVPDAPPELASPLAERTVRVLRPGGEGASRLAARFLDMPMRSRAAVLRIDPIADAEEFGALLRLESQLREDIAAGAARSPEALIESLRATGDPLRRRIATRLENLGVVAWDLWAWGDEAVTDVIDGRADATVVDLGRFEVPEQPRAAALALLDHLWERRHDRVGRLIVIDEAHNLCPPDPTTPLERLLLERIIQIAAEGRKYGLWLLLSTQRPSKVHVNVLSQCDNLALMRMSSARDLAELGAVLGFAPEALVARSPEFAKGQALFAGAFTDEPQVVQMATRATREGGSDVSVPLR